MQIKWILLPQKLICALKLYIRTQYFSVLRNSVLRNSVHRNPGAGSKYICKFKEIQFQNLEKNMNQRAFYSAAF